MIISVSKNQVAAVWRPKVVAVAIVAVVVAVVAVDVVAVVENVSD